MFSRSFFKGLLWVIPALLMLVATVEKTYFEAGLRQEIRLARQVLGETTWDPGEDGGTVKTVGGNGRLSGTQMRRALEGDRSGNWTGYVMFTVGGVERAIACAVGTDRE